ncbi:interleukin-20 receptor subunit beta [Pyxicephalus adspersus]|uniref:interleukin-20 receptor subunit beta n=1 Tax=Pyxicephalus adspersus TaxID=30357 RepID=UPI003B5BC022
MILDDADWLPPPENVSIVSINLNHILHWQPIPKSWGNVTYSVQSQGEFERFYKNNTWNDVSDCLSISKHQCNVTSEVAGNVLYAFRVRSEQEDQRTSVWAEMVPLFNRETSILIPPKITLQAHGSNSLRLDILDFGEYFQFYVYIWQKEKEDQVKSMKLNRMVTSTSFDQLEGGSEYCVNVIAYAVPINKNSSRSDSVCAKVPALGHKALIIGLVLAFVFALVPLALVARKVIRALLYSCCPQVDIPDVLKEPYIGQKMVNSFYAGEEKCDSMSNVELHDLITSQEKFPDKSQTFR